MNASPIVIAGAGQAGPSSADGRSIPEMVLVAVEAALADGGLGWDDVESVVTASVDLIDGLTASNVAVTEVVGAVMKPETRMAADGLCAAIHAVCQLRAQAYRTVLVVGHGKASMTPPAAVQLWAMDPIYLQPLGIDFRMVAGLEARILSDRDPSAVRRWAELAATRRAAAASHGVVGAIAADEILAAPVLASPLTAAMEAPAADAVYAVVLRAGGEGRLRWIGADYDLDVHAPGDRVLGARPGIARAVDRARRAADLGADVTYDLIELSCRYPHEEELVLAALGGGHGAVVSPGGGLWGGDAPCAAGLGRLVDTVRWLRSRSTRARALVHGAWGPAGQGQAIALVEAV